MAKVSKNKKSVKQKKKTKATKKKEGATKTKSPKKMSHKSKNSKYAYSQKKTKTKSSKASAKKKSIKSSSSSFSKKETLSKNTDRVNEIDSYSFNSDNMPVEVRIYTLHGEFVPVYEVSISSISPTTETILEQIRKKLIREVNLGMTDITQAKDTNAIEEKFKETISVMIKRYFPDVDDNVKEYLTTYLIQKSLGMGQIEILMNDNFIEEITINSSQEPVWIFHKKHGWIKTNINIESEEQVRHYAAMIGRRVGRQITVLEPLLDAHLNEGDRVNATIMPISTTGNTITIRRFSREPFTITHFLEYNTLSLEAAALIWLSMQYELSSLIAGGTASGKTSTLNVLATFFPPNQRILSIEDTREIRLPKFLHWVPMNTRTPNTEGKGEVSMEDLLVNSLRMRPDRILVGEVRRQREAETLFEAIHTGHSCYATFHANSVGETINRLTNPPIDVPKTMLPAISLVIVQFRNRRTGKRRTFQLAEVMPDSSFNILMQYNAKKDKLEKVNESKVLIDTLSMYTGFTKKELNLDLKEKIKILQYLLDNKIKTVDGVGRVMAEYYTNKDNLMKFVRQNRLLG
ncbi:MAG: type II/IV secretion system ATPase subunit [Nanobdellota archaeon]